MVCRYCKDGKGFYIYRCPVCANQKPLTDGVASIYGKRGGEYLLADDRRAFLERAWPRWAFHIRSDR